MRLRPGDRVVVKSRNEILATLDQSAEVDSLPFMAEMLEFCGRELEVSAIAHKTCDTVNKTGGRRVANAVHLRDARCDGSAHGGCQAACLLFWKREWLRPAQSHSADERDAPTSHRITASDVAAKGSRISDGQTVYSCQATRLFAASSPLPWWDFRQYIADLTCGNVGITRFLRVALLRGLYHLRRLGIGYRAAVATYDFAHRALTGRPSPYKDGLIPHGTATPSELLNLERGEWVEVRSHDDIRRTTTTQNFNRGMRFDPEMAQFCGRRFRVDRRVDRLIDEKTGRMMVMKSPCIVLDGVVCSSEYSEKRVFCPRAIPPYFREIWLRRAPQRSSELSQ